ncbi:MAG: G1 family endopeptidase [Ferrimicrobium sp.]|jgi:hypothetical protein|nr:G1 family endopeptidase [Ferrimicrobium sp.]
MRRILVMAVIVALALLAWPNATRTDTSPATSQRPPSQTSTLGATQLTADTAPSQPGYYLASKDGGAYAFGTPSYGSTYTYGLTGLGGSHPLNAPIVGMAAAPNGGGYWMVAADGGVFDFGDAPFEGSLVGKRISAPIVAMAATSTTPTITTTALPSAIVGEPYASSITATNLGTAGTLSATGLPAGLSLTQSGTIQGTPTSPGVSTVTVTATNGAATSTQSLDLAVTEPLQGLTTSVTPQASSNWAGYYVEPGSYDAITGTFIVPTLSANQPSYCLGSQPGPTCSLSEWVGIDGANNASLIQAGVELTPVGNGSTYQVYPWWEILPNVQTNVNTLTISAGDQVTINIYKTDSAANWEIQIIDDTTGNAFTTTQTYNGPGASAEWIVEAPSTTNGAILQVPTLNSPVTFSNLGVNTSANGSVSQAVQSFLCQVTTEQPGSLSSDQFQVTQLAGASGPCLNASLFNSGNGTRIKTSAENTKIEALQ